MMGITQQRTLKHPIHCSGVGLHTGERVVMTLHPAGEDEGVRFRRSDLGAAGREVQALWSNAQETPLCSALVDQDGARFVLTIEHLMSALAGCGIDNVVVELTGPEVPIMDGSAAPFVFLIECAGTVEQDAPRRAIKIKRPVSVGDGDSRATLSPAASFSVAFEIDFDNAVVSHQECLARIDEAAYKRDIARARTFGFLHEVDQLRAMGYARGGSLDNAIVISGDRIVNDGGLRFENEFVRHKVLDAVGDLYLAGAPILGHFHGVRAGHALTLSLLKALFADPAAWQKVDLTSDAPYLAAEGGGAASLPARAVAARP